MNQAEYYFAYLDKEPKFENACNICVKAKKNRAFCPVSAFIQFLVNIPECQFA